MTSSAKTPQTARLAKIAQDYAGKNVTAANGGGNMTYFYPHGDILWVVAATDPALTEIFQKLP